MGSTNPSSAPQGQHSATTAPQTPGGGNAAGGGRVARRALLTTAAVGACAVATPFVIEKGAQLTETEVRQLLQREIGSLEGIALDDALKIAELTRKVVQYIVVPLARFLTTIGGDALGIVIASLQRVQQVLGVIRVQVSILDGLIGVMQAWQANVTLLPISLQAYANTDINGAEAYLRALKAKVV
ncbi:MAG: hypothetical protein IVW57_15110 [Ktedonobacterales bacterium]|nr:hypothetical protein [Ktedonobacterales bacterium]